MFPKYIRAPNGAEAKPVGQLHEGLQILYYNEYVSEQLFIYEHFHNQIITIIIMYDTA